MKKWRAEYKVLVALLVIFISILGFILIKEGYIKSYEKERKIKKLSTCTENTFTKGIEYTHYVCTIEDDYGKKYTIEYPKITEKNKEIRGINKTLKKNFDETYHSVEYQENNQKLQLLAYQKVSYKVYYAKGITSFLVENQDIVGTVLNKVNQYKIYNIDATTYKILKEEELKERLGITRDYISSLKGFVVKMYLEKFRYDYNNELLYYRDESIDNTIENITYHAINNCYIDDEEVIHFILYLYNPNYGETIPYNFFVHPTGETSYEILQ